MTFKTLTRSRVRSAALRSPGEIPGNAPARSRCMDKALRKAGLGEARGRSMAANAFTTAYDAPRGWLDAWHLQRLPSDVRTHLLVIVSIWVASACVPVLPVYTEATCVGKCCESDAAWSATNPPSRGSVAYDYGLYCRPHAATKVGAFRSSYFGGCLIGAVVGGSVSDLYGRRTAVLAAAVVLVAATAACTVAPGPPVYAVLRFLAGSAQTALTLAAYVAGLEALNEPWQAPIGSGLFMATFPLGQVVLLLSARQLHDWRTLTLFVDALVLAGLVQAALCLRESPKWLASVEARRRGESKAELKTDATEARPPDSPRLREDGNVGAASSAGDEPWGAMVPMMLLWAAISSAFYGLTLSTGSLMGNLYVNALGSASVELPAALLASSLRGTSTVNAQGEAPKRPWLSLKLACCFALLIGGTICALCSICSEAAQTPLSLVSKFFFTLAFNFVYPYTLEVFQNPTTRTRVMGVCLSSARFGAMLSPLIIARINMTNSFAVFGLFAVASSTLAFIRL